MLTCDEIMQYSTSCLEELGEGIHALWFQIDLSRTATAKQLDAHWSNAPIVTLIVGAGVLENANAVSMDLADLLVAAKPAISDSKLSAIADARRCLLVLLSRTELKVPQTSSPALLPEWVPVFGGREIGVCIRDATWRAAAPLSSSHVATQSLRRRLHSIEHALIRRISFVRGKDHGSAGAFWELLRATNPTPVNIQGLLDEAAASLRDVNDPESFRPSVKESRALVCRVYSLWTGTSPDGLHKLSQALSRALGLPPEIGPWRVSLLTLLSRQATPAYHQTTSSVRFARNGVIVISAIHLLSTASAHADEYPHFPVHLLRSVALDLRDSADDFIDVLARADVDTK